MDLKLHPIEEESLHSLQNFRMKFERLHKVDKYKLHIAEIDKIVNLIFSLKYRLDPVENALKMFDWNGVDEIINLKENETKFLIN